MGKAMVPQELALRTALVGPFGTMGLADVAARGGALGASSHFNVLLVCGWPCARSGCIASGKDAPA